MRAHCVYDGALFPRLSSMLTLCFVFLHRVLVYGPLALRLLLEVTSTRSDSWIQAVFGDYCKINSMLSDNAEGYAFTDTLIRNRNINCWTAFCRQANKVRLRNHLRIHIHNHNEQPQHMMHNIHI